MAPHQSGRRTGSRGRRRPLRRSRRHGIRRDRRARRRTGLARRLRLLLLPAPYSFAFTNGLRGSSLAFPHQSRRSPAPTFRRLYAFTVERRKTASAAPLSRCTLGGYTLSLPSSCRCRAHDGAGSWSDSLSCSHQPLAESGRCQAPSSRRATCPLAICIRCARPFPFPPSSSGFSGFSDALPSSLPPPHPQPLAPYPQPVALPFARCRFALATFVAATGVRL